MNTRFEITTLVILFRIPCRKECRQLTVNERINLDLWEGDAPLTRARAQAASAPESGVSDLASQLNYYHTNNNKTPAPRSRALTVLSEKRCFPEGCPMQGGAVTRARGVTGTIPEEEEEP